MVVQLTCNEQAVGSNPTKGSYMEDLEKYLFLTVCSHTKNLESFEREMPLCEMYTGSSYCARVNLLKLITDEIYITSLLGPGIVRDTFVALGYDAPPPTILKKYVKEPGFCEERRRMFEERYPGRIDKVEKVFFLGDSNYDDCIKGIFPDKEVVIIMKKKLSVGKMTSFFSKITNFVKNIDPFKNYKKRYYEYNGWLFEYQKSICNLYRIDNDKYYEVDGFSSDTNFITKFRELTGNKTSQQYCECVQVKPKKWELTHPTIEKYFKKILQLQPVNIDESKLIKNDYLNDNIFDKRFTDILKQIKME